MRTEKQKQSAALDKIKNTLTRKAFISFSLHILLTVAFFHKYTRETDTYKHFKIAGCLLSAVMSYNYIIDAITSNNCVNLNKIGTLYAFFIYLFFIVIRKISDGNVDMRSYVIVIMLSVITLLTILSTNKEFNLAFTRSFITSKRFGSIMKGM